MYRFGAQSKVGQQQLLKQEKRVSSFVQFKQPVSQSQNDVNLLLSILTSKDHITYTTSQLLSYVIHYLPKVKNAKNLDLLTKSFLENSIIFKNYESISLNDTYLIIEASKALFESKIRISEPTLPVEKFYHVFIEALYSSPMEHWKKSLIVTGILLTNPFYQEYSVPETDRYFQQAYHTLINFNHELITVIFKDISYNIFEVNALTTISLACSLPFFSELQKKHLPHSLIFMLTIDLIFQSPYGLVIGNTEDLQKNDSPVLKHLNRLSFLVENCLLCGVDFPRVNNSLQVILQFSKTLHTRVVNTPQSWDYVKNILFGVIIIFQGYSSYLLNIQNGLKKQEIPILSTQIMKSLFNLNFIIERIGTGGFKAYNFVYLTNLNALLQYSITDAEETGGHFISHIDLNEVPENHYVSSKTLFTLIFFESLAQSCSEIYYHNTISSFVDHFISNSRPNSNPEFSKTQRSIVEASHSVVLSTFSIAKNSTIVATTAIPYFQTILSQFPLFLSATQIRIAVEGVIKAVAPPSPAYYLNKDNFRELLHILYTTILNTRPDVPLPTQKTPSTTRSALIYCLISIMPYLDAKFLHSWLENIWELAEESTVKEFNFLEDALWKLLSEGLDLQKSNIGIQWWYSRGLQSAKL